MSSVTTSLDRLFEDYSEQTSRPRAKLRSRVGAVHAVGRFTRLVVTWTVMGAASAFLLGLVVPTFFGYHDLVVMSGSMEPTIHTGDMIVDQQVSALDVKVGDIVTFKDPEDASRLISHRVRSISIRGNVVHLETKGDASNAVQKWDIAADGRVGRVVAHLWKLGYVMAWVTLPWGRLLLVAVPALMLGAWELLAIWRPKKPKEKEPENAEA